MNYKDYQSARDAAWRVLLDCGVTKLPVAVSEICRKLGITVRLYDPAGGPDGISMILDGTPVILVSKWSPPTRQRFTAAHELGHIVLGHVGRAECHREPKRNSPEEHAANVFAASLLAPSCVLWACDAWTPEEIMKLCNISYQSAWFRAQRIALLRERNKFLISPLEQRLYQQFLPFIAEHTR